MVSALLTLVNNTLGGREDMEREKVKETEGIKGTEKKCLYPVVDERACRLSLKMFEVKTNLRAKAVSFCF